MLGKTELLAQLQHWAIPFSCEAHEAVFNMAESDGLVLALDGERCKNLLLQDRKGGTFLVVTTASKALDLAAAAVALGSKRLSFASADTLFERLGVRPGSLSPLALVNDAQARVQLAIDAELAGASVFLFHPLSSDASVALTRAALDAFLERVAHRAQWVTLAAREPAA